MAKSNPDNHGRKKLAAKMETAMLIRQFHHQFEQADASERITLLERALRNRVLKQEAAVLARQCLPEM